MTISTSLLIIEDDSYTRDTLAGLLRRRYPDADIHSADDGRTGLECFTMHSPDVVVTDIAMPGMDGISMAAEMKAIDPQVAIIAVTAFTDTTDLIKAIEIGIDHYLVKPLKLDKLFLLIDKQVACREEVLQRKRSEDALRLGEERHQHELRLLNEQLERRVKERTAELEAAVSELESFSYTISHDLRAPLRHINCFSAMLSEDFGKVLPQAAHGYLERIAGASSRMGELIDHLLELSRVMRVEIRLEPVNLSFLASDVLKMLRETEPARHVEIVIQEGIAVLGDPYLLRQMLENLLGNAWKYTSTKELARIELGRTQVAGEEAIFVRDNGAGFDMAYQSSLFEVFQRLHGGEFEGVGIGLATALRIIQRHKGKIWAEAKVDEGATFFFTLPRSYAIPAPQPQRFSGRGEIY